MKKKHLNWLFEFKNKSTETKYIKETQEKSKSSFILILLFYALTYTLFSFLDKQLAHESILPYLFANRITTFILIVFLLIVLYKVKSFNISTIIMYTISLILVTSFLIIIFQYNNPDYFYIESLSIIILTLGLYTQPIQSLFKIVLSLFLNIGFTILMLVTNHGDHTVAIMIIFAFLLVNLMMNILIMCQSNFLKRINYLDTKKLEKLSSTDYLTGVLSRSSFFEKAENEIKKANSYENVLTFIYVDFDGFKIINDSYGHDIGDKVLIEITNIINIELTTNNIFGRFGGDEFGILMINYTYDQSMLFIKKLEQKIQNYTNKNEYGTTCTFGVAPYLPSDTLLELIQKADIDLYKKKNKNQSTL